MDKTPRFIETPPDWTPDERPTLPVLQQQSPTHAQSVFFICLLDYL